MRLYDARFMLAERAPRLYGALRKAADAAIRFRSRERREAFGELNPDRTIYIIRFRREKLGLMALYLNVLLRIKEASDRGMVPVVDLQNYPNTYLEQDLLHRVNSWEYYFRQPSRISLEEAYRSANVVLSDMETPVLGSPRSFYQSCLCGPRAGEYLSVARDRMGFADEFAEYFEGQLRNVFAPRSSGRVLGIVSRGTDLVGFEGHSVQPTLNELVSAARALIKTYDISAVYVASDSDSALESIREELGRDVVFSFDQRRFDCYGTSGAHVLSDVRFNRNDDAYLRGREYLTVVGMLSRCNVLLGSLVGATVGAMCLNGAKFDHVEIIDKGVYGGKA